MKITALLFWAIAAVMIIGGLYGLLFAGDEPNSRAIAQLAGLVVGAAGLFVAIVAGLFYWIGS